MSIQEAVKHILVGRGMSVDLADEVIAYMQADPANAPMQGRWQDDVKAYSAQLLTVLVSLPQEKFGSIDENSARIWFRPLFVSFDPQAG